MEWQHRRDADYPDRRVAKHFRSPADSRIAPGAITLVVSECNSEHPPSLQPSQHYLVLVTHCQADRSRHQPVYELATTILLLHISLRH